MAFSSDEEDSVVPSSSNLFCKDAFVVIKPGYQPSRLPEAPFFLGKCKKNIKASERKLTVSIYAQYQLLPFNFVDAQPQCQIEISGILRKAENVRIEDDVAALDEDVYSSYVIDDHWLFGLLPSFKPWRTRCESVNYGISNYWSTQSERAHRDSQDSQVWC